MASRLVSETLVTLRSRGEMPTVSGISRAAAQRAMIAMTIAGFLLFFYLVEVSQGTTTVFDIEALQVELLQMQERNQELERQIAELESPGHVMEYVGRHGMGPRTGAEYLILRGGR